MTQTKKVLTKDTKEPQQGPQKFEKAYILPAPVGDRLKAALMEMPMKYGQMLGPLVDALEKAYRADVTVQQNPQESET